MSEARRMTGPRLATRSGFAINGTRGPYRIWTLALRLLLMNFRRYFFLRGAIEKPTMS
jgi:hypothetical protein